MNAAISILSESGSQDLTFEKVAQEAGVNRTTLYRRWETKSRLIAWAMLEFMDKQIPQPNSGNVRSDLIALLTNVNKFMGTPLATTFFQVMGVEARHDSAIADAARAYWDQRGQLVQKILERAKAQNELPANLDNELFIERVFGPFYFRLLTQAGGLKRTQLERIVDRALEESKD